MGIGMEKGHEYKGYKLGEKVKWREDNSEHIIIGFCEIDYVNKFIAISIPVGRSFISERSSVHYLKNADGLNFAFVSEDEIKKIETDVEKENKEIMEKIKQYDLESLRERIKKADELAFEEHKKRFGCPLRESEETEKENRHIKPNYYKINVAGTECEVKDVIKATVKDYDSVLIANIIKYVMRYRGKNGLEDLKKARTYLDELISLMENSNDR